MHASAKMPKFRFLSRADSPFLACKCNIGVYIAIIALLSLCNSHDYVTKSCDARVTR